MESRGARKDGRNGLREQAGWRREVMSCVSQHMLRKSKETFSHLPPLLFLCFLSLSSTGLYLRQFGSGTIKAGGSAEPGTITSFSCSHCPSSLLACTPLLDPAVFLDQGARLQCAEGQDDHFFLLHCA